METSFCELRGKEVINVVDGKRLGKIIDIVFDTRFGKMLGIVVPCYNKSWNIFKQCDDIFIPFSSICKFGEDAILVQIYIQNQNVANKKNKYGVFNSQNPRTCSATPVEENNALSQPTTFTNDTNYEQKDVCPVPPPLYPDNQ